MPKIIKPMDPDQESLYKLLCGANNGGLDGIKLGCDIDNITWSSRKRRRGRVYEARLWRKGECKYVVSYYVTRWDYITTFSVTVLNVETKTSINSEYGSTFFQGVNYEKFREQFKSVTSLDPYLFS